MTRFYSFVVAAVVALPIALASWSANAGKTNIVDTATQAGTFQTLIKAVQAAGLEDKLKGNGPYTVFAPTDAAFAKLPEGTLEDLLKPENKQKLVDLLSKHVISGQIMAADIAGKKAPYETLAGTKVTVNAAGRVAKVEHAAIQQPDVLASNGVIHVIDKVITTK